MPKGFSRLLHAGWFALVDRVSRVTTKVASIGLDMTLALRREAQRSRRIADGVDPGCVRRRAIVALLWRRKLAVACVGFGLLAIALIAQGRVEWGGTSIVASLVFLGLELDDLNKERP